MSDKEKRFLTVKETAKYLGRSESHIYDLLKEDELPAAKLGGKWLVDKKRLDKMFEVEK